MSQCWIVKSILSAVSVQVTFLKARRRRSSDVLIGDVKKRLESSIAKNEEAKNIHFRFSLKFTIAQTVLLLIHD